MPNLNIYIKESDEAIIERLKQMLLKEERSVSEFVADAAKDYVESRGEPEDIELEGEGVKRVFKGSELYWEKTRDSELGVFLTAKGQIAYWSYVPYAIGDGDKEEFEVYETLDEFLEEDWINEKRNKSIKAAVQREYAALTSRTVVERLDI
jgi:hypothetical protein